ncbi:OmpA family protein [Acuticoccus sp. M5D2P5]|uniref:flagellar motor protein MotB n=1 Tax=Acuticoccus kalidii TaxID=2910977 RepID=UPI001F1C57A7|nr:flagellar motor protein MotB [Acuticoccus kalidii]MCF3932457.1 OmpA family protein [Acuticoccus kalidii]
MSSDKQEIIILKRVEEVADAKKGGVWKIAHADFMTAMMAFFLIMWLVNATDEEIKKSIANYFNPMNLMASPTDARGIMDIQKDAEPPVSGNESGEVSGTRPLGNDRPGEGGIASGGNAEEGNDNKMDSAGILEATDGASFNDPYAVMASAASDANPEDPVQVDVPDSTLGTTGTTAVTESVRDPFDPAYWQTTSPRVARTLRPGPADAADQLPPNATIDVRDRRPTDTPQPGPFQTDQSNDTIDATANTSSANTTSSPMPAPPPDAPTTAQPVIVGPRSAMAEAIIAAFGDDSTGTPNTTSPPSATAQTDASDVASPPPPPSAPIPSDASDALEAIRDALAGTGIEVGIDETGGEDKVLISLTDDSAFSMFPIGSASPTAEASDLFARVAGALASRDGRIVVRGHTDARPFRGGTSDNWVLSFSRAHATKDALVENGVPEDRIARVEGLADREPSRPEDPLADENRRIEILYEPTGDTP